MAVDPERFHKPVRKLRKRVKKISRRATPDEVHALRSNTRRVEASLQALGLASKRNSKRLLKDLTRLRKRAGKMRDMDVLTSFASTVHPRDENDCAVQLLEHLGAKRRKYAKRPMTDWCGGPASLLYSEVKEIDDLNPTVLQQIEAFFVNYQEVRNVTVKIIRRSGPTRSAGNFEAGGASETCSLMQAAAGMNYGSKYVVENGQPDRVKIGGGGSP